MPLGAVSSRLCPSSSSTGVSSAGPRMSRGDLNLLVVRLQVGGVHVARTSFRFCCPSAAPRAADGQQNRNDVRATWTPPTCRWTTNRLRSPRDILGPAEDTPVELEEGQSRLETAPRGMAAEVSHSFGSSSDRHSRRAAPKWIAHFPYSTVVVGAVAKAERFTCLINRSAG